MCGGGGYCYHNRVHLVRCKDTATIGFFKPFWPQGLGFTLYGVKKGDFPLFRLVIKNKEEAAKILFTFLFL